MNRTISTWVCGYTLRCWAWGIKCFKSLQPARLTLPNSSYITNTYDHVARLTSIYLKNSVNSTLDSYAYIYDPANERANLTRFDLSTVGYKYDPIGQLRVADSSVNAEDRGYTYDAAWNLVDRTNNGALTAINVDNLNQLSTDSANIHYYYDANGNLNWQVFGSDPWWWTTAEITSGYQYDDENRLSTWTFYGYNNTSFPQLQTQFYYDGLGRLRKRVEYQAQYSGGEYLGLQWSGEVHYIYDGWRVIQERDINNTPTVSYTRGTDLSGSLEGAGGIGGLLARSDGYSGGNWTSHNYYFADANGNVTYMLNGSQIMVASYRYDPFGNTISSTGTLATNNIYRFSSKEIHASSGMYYFGYRFYDPNLQRWINRDPIEERGGINLYEFIANEPVALVDHLGLECGVTFRRYPGGGGHQWISQGGQNAGFYPPGTWVDENQYSQQAGRPDPNDPNNYYEWDTKRKNSGTLPDGTPCSAATCQQIQDCIGNKTGNGLGTPKFNPLFNNCRQQSKDVAKDCCLEKGRKINSPHGGRGGSGRGSDDTSYGSGFLSGSSRQGL